MVGIVHALTPGDHFSPRTGSALPTVVHGLASAARADGDSGYRHEVLVARGTMTPRYDSAEVIEYDGEPFPSPAARALDAVRGRLGLPRRAALRAFAPLARALRDSPPVIVLAHNAPALPRLLDGSPHTVVLYAHNDLVRSFSRGEAERRLRGVAAVVCVSEDLAERMSSRMPATLAARMRVVENGVDATRFAPRSGERPPGPLRVMFVGRAIADKGPDVLLEAAALLGRDDIEVVVVGSNGFSRDDALTAFERALRSRAADIPAHVRFEPFVDRSALPSLLATADVFVAPSRWPEPSGLTIGEALATGLPVIASDTGGIPGVLGDAGLLVPPGDAAALAAAIGRLADDPRLRASLAERARARAVAHDWSRSWAQLRRVLDEVSPVTNAASGPTARG